MSTYLSIYVRQILDIGEILSIENWQIIKVAILRSIFDSKSVAREFFNITARSHTQHKCWSELQSSRRRHDRKLFLFNNLGGGKQQQQQQQQQQLLERRTLGEKLNPCFPPFLVLTCSRHIVLSVEGYVFLSFTSHLGCKIWH